MGSGRGAASGLAEARFAWGRAVGGRGAGGPGSRGRPRGPAAKGGAGPRENRPIMARGSPMLRLRMNLSYGDLGSGFVFVVLSS